MGLQRKLVPSSPVALAQAATLTNLGVLYEIAQRRVDAKKTFCDALGIYVSLLPEDPLRYLPYVSQAEIHLSIFHSQELVPVRSNSGGGAISRQPTGNC